MGKTPARANPDYWNGSNKWVSISDLSGYDKYVTDTKECISDLGVSESGIKAVPKNTVIMSFKLSIGKTAITTEDIYTNEAIMAFIDKGVCEIDTDYLYYLFSGMDWNKGTNKAVLGLTLNKATLSKKEIDIPDLHTQNEVVKKLDSLSNVIQLQKHSLDKLDELIKSRFVEMFGDPSINTFNWIVEPLSCHLSVIGGYAFKSDLFVEDGIPILRIGNINTGVFRSTNLVFWENDTQLERYKMYPGDLVISLTGTVGKDDYGNVCILGNDYDVYYLNQRNAKLELKPTLNKTFLSELLKFKEIKTRLTGISRGVRQANISNNDILNLCVPIPPIELQNQFADYVSQVDKTKSAVKQSIEKLETLKKSLMQDFFG